MVRGVWQQGTQVLLAQLFYQSYLRQYGLSIGILRPSNVLGGGDHSGKRLVPSILNCLESNMTLEIRNSLSVHPWQHILDTSSDIWQFKIKECEQGAYKACMEQIMMYRRWNGESR